MNPVKLFSNLFEQITEGVSSNFINEVAEDPDKLTAFNGAKERIAKSSKIHQEEELNAQSPRNSEARESFNSDSFSRQFFAPEIDIQPLPKRGFGLEEKRSFNSYRTRDNASKSFISPPPREEVDILRTVATDSIINSKTTSSQKIFTTKLGKTNFRHFKPSLETIEEIEENLEEERLSPPTSPSIKSQSNNSSNDLNNKNTVFEDGSTKTR